ncbi:hypothetical protein H6P81_011214 [Aristolochia fimbriata]|uniref:Yippee domain-containing protein n=1 Tax=Aristolochia fimbriata TaxID=158543 RepID=A0AAV7ERN9_ARIFI|nr:hypothetical protein H6P81_011214 [Aristolochia fimbriata]
MGRIFTVELDGNIYSCKHCRTHLAFDEDIVSKSFHCRYGKAYLFSNVREDDDDWDGNMRLLMTGAKSIQKGSLFLKGFRYWDLRDQITG